MVTRSLTEPFILMRNNASQTRHIYSEQNSSDRTALVGLESAAIGEVELGSLNWEDHISPAWSDALEETQYILSRLRTKLAELKEVHARHLTRPTLDDTSKDERLMEQLTREMGRAFTSGHRQVQLVKTAAKQGNRASDRRLAASAAIALSSALQELGLSYRTAQNHYLQQLNSREERSRQYFSDDQEFLSIEPLDSWATDMKFAHVSSGSGSSCDQQHMNQMQQEILLHFDDEQRTRQAKMREQEVVHIVQSIAELNHIFKDLAHMVQDQGSILDRIDYNVEQTQAQVQEGYKQLKKADSYQRANRKLYCIMVLTVAIIFVCLLFVILKT
ncbi:syntaxin-16 [Athalia rosae]|uniref:syntaxin-16 n=1 Tax=Athalia rosae TaxID=37344 RepID=UPI000626CF46|nr:syntaxin-16 [Athalia rosae]XP_048506873.1 syntaxin-16 [Athalia rosae]XP_048506874.1 syntaxin-16 [Athalia rosae]